MKRTTKTLRSLLGIIVLGCLGGVVAMVWLTLPPTTGKQPSTQKPEITADLRLDRVHYTETREGVKEWDLDAASAIYFKEGNTVRLEKIRATFFGREKEIYFLEAEKGTFNTQTRVVEVSGDVKIDSSTGYHVRTQHLRYEAEKKELHTSDPVEMKGPELEVKGVGLILDLNQERMKILADVSTTLYARNEKKSLFSGH